MSWVTIVYNINDYVTRKSYNNDIVFKILFIEYNKAILQGVDVRLCADANIEDLKKVEQIRATEEIANLPIKSGNYLNGKVLHLDGDNEYLKKSMKLYEQYKDCELIITPDSPAVRKKIVAHYGKIGYTFATVISPNAFVSKYASLGQGCIIQAGANISAGCKISNYVKLNVNSNVMHDNIIGDYTTIAPNAVLLGYVTVGEMAYIGANSTILPRTLIGKSTLIGAGAVVTKDVMDGVVVKGVPAK